MTDIRQEAERIVAEQCSDWRWPGLADEKLSEWQLAVDACEAGLIASNWTPPVAQVIISGLVMVHGKPMSIAEIEARIIP